MSHGDWKDMFRAIQANDEELVMFHIRNGVDINYQHPEYMTNALCESIRCSRENLVLLLLQHGSSVNIREMDTGKTPLEIAKEIGFQSVIKILETHAPIK
jgi:ankyrin repeat protein